MPEPAAKLQKTFARALTAAAAVLVIGIAVPLSASADAIVSFPDPGLEVAIREAIGKPTGDILESDLVGLTELYAVSRGISDLTGIGHCSDLLELNLTDNRISDLTPLVGLTKLTELYLIYNPSLSNLAPIAVLTQLPALRLLNLEGSGGILGWGMSYVEGSVGLTAAIELSGNLAVTPEGLECVGVSMQVRW